MKLAIIDDEKAFAERLRSYVLTLFAEKHTAVDITVTDNSEFILYNGKRFDVILLDIEMPGCSGIDLASKLNEKKNINEKPFIIFVTNRDGLVFDALKQQPFSFVRKSHLEDLEPCFDRLITLCESDIYYPIKSGRDIERVALKDIFYLEKQKNYIQNATSDNICFYMAVNQINKNAIRDVCLTARDTKNVRAVSFNFHTPYPDTRELALSKEEKVACCNEIEKMMKAGVPVFNLKSAFPYLINNSFPTPCHQCVVIENGKLSTCGRCIDIPGLCDECGYFFVAEYTLLFKGKPKIIIEMLRTYLKYI